VAAGGERITDDLAHERSVVDYQYSCHWFGTPCVGWFSS
jgi:hypothetical protein